MSPASRGLAPREGLECLLVKMGRTRPLVEPRRGPQAGESGDPRSQDADINFQVKGRYFITREEAGEYERTAEVARLQEAARQAVAAAAQYNANYDFGYHPGQSWP